MNVFFLGTGAAEGLPGLFCNCGVCAFAREHGGREKRLRTGVLIDGIVRIDLPPDSLAQVHAYPEVRLCDLEYLLITHTHDDHFSARELQYLSPNFAPERKKPLRIWGTEYCLERIHTVMGRFFEPAPLALCMVEPFQTYSVAHLRVTPITAHHKQDELCLNYILTDTATGKTLLYASDTGWYKPETWEFLAGVRLDAAIVECGLGAAQTGYEGHLSITGCAAFREKLIADGSLSSNAPFYMTHISHTGLLNHDAMVARAAPLGMQVAYDGLQISV